MKKLKSVVIGLILVTVFLLVFQKPLLYSYYTFNSVEIEVKYKSVPLLNSNNIETSAESEFVQYESVSDDTFVKLPHKTDIITIKTEAAKSSVYQLQTCFEKNGYYCFVFSCMLRHFPYNAKTHRGDMLVVVDENGNEKHRYKSDNDEWVLDYENDTVLIYNSKKNSFNSINATNTQVEKSLEFDCGGYNRVIINYLDYGNYVWQALFYRDNDLICKKTASAFNA